ncbi:hypothetical protein PsorP6_012499 [Peronosclerospora sorghi]|uniref:Uncharacterized protein n=1 Tax=Peronosclerospora sorghi TaxID=230839 RepID=A0ACC0WF87_9STRA|nr:hypothetical protein PsorP6_012499 [Peronosclerospora sorghi]
MLWPRDDFHAAYGQIKHDAVQSNGTCSILILVAMDVDALCAAEILTRLLRADLLSYAQVAVRGYDDVVHVRETRVRGTSSGDLRSIIMLNCGAIVDLATVLALPRHMKCYVLDSHRPIHLANIYDAHQQIVVFDDGALALDEYPAFGSELDVADFEDEEDEEEEEEEESDEEEGSEEEAEVAFETVPDDPAMDDKRDASEKRKRADETEDGEGEEEEGGDEKEEKRVKKRREGDDDDEEMEEDEKERQDTAEDDVPEAPNAGMAKRQRRDEILKYYRGSFHGAPAATVAFELAQQMNCAERGVLWCAILGVTKQFLFEEIDADNYTLLVTRLQDEVLALATPSRTTAPNDDNDDDARYPGYEDGKITFEEEYRFMCYRHWSLYEAMYYSDYVASTLGLYQDQVRRVGARTSETGAGETALHVFLARMGFSLRESQQKFVYMALEMKDKLREKTLEMAPEFGLDDLFYGSFRRTFAFQYQLCAADAVYGLQALLDAPESYIAAVFEAEMHHAQPSAWLSELPLEAVVFSSRGTAGHDGNQDDATADESSPDDSRQQNFLLAHTALACQSVTSSKLMESGIKVAMALKQAIVRVGLSIMERKLVVRVKHFRYVCVQVPEREQELFANANVLTQLALFLLHVHRASGKWSTARARAVRNEGDDGDVVDEASIMSTSIVPLVLLTRNPAQNCYLIVGITCPSTPGEIHRNTLGTAFKLAAAETGATFRQDGFTSAVMEIQMDEIQSFLEQLHNVLDA